MKRHKYDGDKWWTAKSGKRWYPAACGNRVASGAPSNFDGVDCKSCLRTRPPSETLADALASLAEHAREREFAVAVRTVVNTGELKGSRFLIAYVSDLASADQVLDVVVQTLKDGEEDGPAKQH